MGSYIIFQASGALVTLMDIFPTVLDWFDIDIPTNDANELFAQDDAPKSLLSILEKGTLTPSI